MPRESPERPAAEAVGAIPLTAIVTHAVVQLYLEEVRPKARVLQWMVLANTGVHVQLEPLLRACRSAPGLVVDGEAGGREEHRVSKWTVKLLTPPAGFQRFTDGLDEPIPEGIFQDVATALSSGGWSTECPTDHQSFEIAAWLKTIAGLSHLSLGRAMSIVRQGLHVYWLLGKRRERLVPFGASEECERHSNVLAGLPTGVAPGERYVATWAGLRRCLAVLLRERGGSLPAAGLKQAFRARFGAELSETPFGYTSVAMLVRSPQLSQLASVTPGHGPSACRLELRPEAADCSELDLADAFAVCRPQDPAQLAQLRQEVVSSMVGLAGGRSTGWHNTMTLPYPAHLAAAPDQAHPAYHGRADPASAAHAGRAAAPRDEAPGPAAASGASPAQSSPCASSSSGVAAASAARAPPPLRLQLSECLPESQDTPSLFSEDSPWATAEAARGAPWWMCPPTSPARGPLQPRAGAPVGRQGPAAGRPAEAPAEAACGRGQAPAVKENLAPPLSDVSPSAFGSAAAAEAGGVHGTPPPKDRRCVAFRSPACYDSPPPASEAARTSPPTSATPPPTGTGGPVTRSSALSTASSPSPLPNWCSVRHTFIEAQIQPDEDEWPIVTTSRSKSSPPQFQFQ